MLQHHALKEKGVVKDLKEKEALHVAATDVYGNAVVVENVQAMVVSETVPCYGPKSELAIEEIKLDPKYVPQVPKEHTTKEAKGDNKGKIGNLRHPDKPHVQQKAWRNAFAKAQKIAYSGRSQGVGYYAKNSGGPTPEELIFIRSEVADHYSNDLTNYRDRKRKRHEIVTGKRPE